MKNMHWSLTNLLNPLSKDRFLLEYWGRNFLRVEGARGRFDGLMDFDRLAALLEQHRFRDDDLRVVRAGKAELPNRYRAKRGDGAVLSAAMLTRRIAEGCSIVLNQVDEISPSVREVAMAFEEELGSWTQANLYASWQSQPGFDLHWDDHHVIVLQTVGSKHWKIHAPTRTNPVREDKVKAPPPQGDPVWSGLLNAGDLLYLPRGWWHMATATEGPSLHLTMTIAPETGIQFVKWFAQSLRRFPIVREDVPNFRTEAERAVWLDSIFELMTREWNRGDLIHRFTRNRRSQRAPRTRIELPSGAASPIAITGDSLVKLAACEALEPIPDAEGGSSRVTVNENSWQCSTAMIPALEALDSDRGITVRELCARVAEPGEALQFTRLLTTLALSGVIIITNDPIPQQEIETNQG